MRYISGSRKVFDGSTACLKVVGWKLTGQGMASSSEVTLKVATVGNIPKQSLIQDFSVLLL